MYYPEDSEIHFILSGDEPVRIESYACLSNCEEPVPTETDVEPFMRRWSDPTNWPNNQLPGAGDDVVIPATWNVSFDVTTTPVLGSLSIEGSLTFEDSDNRKLQAEAISVRGGELHIGSNSQPFEHQAEIILHEWSSSEAKDTLLNKEQTLLNVGLVKMFGQPRNKRMSRLTKSSTLGSKYIKTEPNLNLKPGDRIALLSSSYDGNLTDEATVRSYNSKTGTVILDEGL
mmetsp:Transcript_36043/g.55346  ORF Transcript_36043/g.55346 Transcript_36043/m.55346 type:complete len:229 (+) Transcript_36043:1531-2217(+)